MTSPALIVLSLVLVCSIFGTSSEQIADLSDTTDFDIKVDKLWTNKISKNYVNNINNINKVIFNPINKHQDTNESKLKTIKEMDIRVFNNHNINKDSKLYNKEHSLPIENDEIDKNHHNGNKIIYVEDKTKTNDRNKSDKIYRSKDNILEINLRKHKANIQRYNELHGLYNNTEEVKKRVKRDDDDPRCEHFRFTDKDSPIMHPHTKNRTTYFNNSNCVTVINATSDTQVIELAFVDMFHIEYHPKCAYDYLEIRDGIHGYATSLGKVCGEAFPRQITTTGPHAWLKFYSDDTIEYEGFKINIMFKNGIGYRIPDSCYIKKDGPNEDKYGVIDSMQINQDCISGSSNHALDVLWRIETTPGTKIYLNFTVYNLEKPNECEHNVIQVFGAVLEEDSLLTYFCGSVANSVTTKGEESVKDGKADPGNIMYVRMYASKSARSNTKFNATYNAFRVIQPNKESDSCEPHEFSCEDNTCIDAKLMCDGDAHCRLKADEDKSNCDNKTESTINQPHILVILIIFSLILSGMSFVFIFKCVRKLYQDHKLITEHFKQSTEDHLDSLDSSHLTLDPKRLQRDSEPRASLERENHTNEMYKKQRSFSKHEPSSRESHFIEETRVDLEDDPWRREVDSVPIEDQDIRLERNGRSRRSDMSRKEESIRSRTKESEGSRVKKEIRDVSVGAPDTKESGCQTRESLFQTDPPPSSDGSGSQSRGFSTFGYSGATIARPSPGPEQTKTSEITIELLKQMPSQESKPQKKILDRRPISTETTRSAPDVIIVSKPIR